MLPRFLRANAITLVALFVARLRLSRASDVENPRGREEKLAPFLGIGRACDDSSARRVHARERLARESAPTQVGRRLVGVAGNAV
jgi:hypothetical protein